MNRRPSPRYPRALGDLDDNGSTIKAMLWANRNGFFYILDRVTGQLLTGYPFSRINWTNGLDDRQQEA
ncbi:uncharacterized protein METZ01_LOCUS463651 [marine metagenome]|uniref:Uncharacterized protein n=1 Tax=marine metagenome TaxID=408172 RepID=A0A383ASK1_9ZZZZ